MMNILPLQISQKNNKVPYISFDNLLLSNINLFAIPKDEHLVELERSLDKLIQAIPSLKRIFSKPITRLKDVHNILPIESVRVINNQSISHVSRHCELWGDITDGKLKPKKLLTLDRLEDYALYENIAFTKLIKIILSFIRKKMFLLKDIMYSTREFSINLLERTNHLSYFLAIGKLHLGYARAQDKYNLAYERCLNKLMFISNVLHSKLHCPVYQACKKSNEKLVLKKTNIFRHQKDYKKVYSLPKWFSSGESIADDFSFDTPPEEGYSAYCNILSVFALGHFGFNFDKSLKINFDNLKTNAIFMDWKLTFTSFKLNKYNGLKITVEKNKPYSIGLIYSTDGNCPENFIPAFKAKFELDECFIASPFTYTNKNFIYLSLFDIDSFRRIQQLTLKAMIYSDSKKTVCPFCGKKLVKMENGYVCSSCRTEIYKNTCPKTKKKYFSTGITGYDPLQEQKNEIKDDKFLTDKLSEAQMHFRNITEINALGKTICPHCGSIH